MNFLKDYKRKKITTIIKYLFFGILIAIISEIFISNVVCLIFMIIKNTTGYCTPFMAETIKKVVDINVTALKMWAEDC